MGKTFKPSGSRPKAAASVLQSTLRYLRIDKKLERYEAFPMWREIVGDDIADVTRPEKISRGKIMVVRVKDAAWAQELSLKKREILTKVRDANTGAYIEDIRFVTGSPEGFE